MEASATRRGLLGIVGLPECIEGTTGSLYNSVQSLEDAKANSPLAALSFQIFNNSAPLGTEI